MPDNTSSFPLVSVVMPAYNAEEFIGKSIQSVLDQTYENWELIIVDDHSIDGTVDVVETYVRRDDRIQFYRLAKNSGLPAIPRNHALEKARGNWIALLDADDIWVPEKLAIQIKCAAETGAGFIFSGYEVIDARDRKLSIYNPPDSVTYEQNLISNRIGCLTALFRKDLLPEGYFITDRKLRGREDYIMWLYLLKKEARAVKADSIPLASYRILEGSVSRSKWKIGKAMWNVYYRVEKFSVLKSIYYWMRYGLDSFVKYSLHDTWNDLDL